MGRSIDDWYADAEGRGGAVSHDWENDEAPDRSPEAWLDRLTPGRDVRASVPEQRRGRPGPGGSQRRRPSTAASAQQVAALAQRVLADRPGISYQRVAEILRAEGWPGVDRKDVSVALAAHPVRSAAARIPRARPRLAGPVTAPTPWWTPMPVQRAPRARGGIARPVSYRAEPSPLPRFQAATCPACGLVPAANGACRCS